MHEEISRKIFPDATPKSRLAKVKILEAFMLSVQEVGFAKTSYDTIAKRAETSRARVHYHFDNIERMNLYAVHYIYHFGQHYTHERVIAVESWQEKILGFVDGALDWLEFHPTHMTILLLSYYQASVGEEFRKLYDETRERGRKRFYAIIESIFPKSSFETEACVLYMQRVLFGALVELSCSQKNHDLEMARKVLKRDFLSGLSRIISPGTF